MGDSILTLPTPPPHQIYQCSWLSLKFKWQQREKRNPWLWRGVWRGGGGGRLLRKRPAIYVLVLCKYYMSSTFAQLFGITSTGWVYYFRNHALFMERDDLLPDTPLPLALSFWYFSLSSPPPPFLSLSSHLFLIHSQSTKSQLLVPAEQLQGRETQMEMFVENNMCIIKV